MIPGTEEIDDLDQFENEDEGGAPAGGGGKGGDKGKEETVTLTKAELDSLRRENSELRQSERDLMAMFRQNGGRKPADVEVDEPEEEDVDPDEFVDDKAPDGNLPDDTPEKLVDELAAQGVKALGKRGFITAKDAQRIAVEVAAKVSRQLIGRERQKITSDTQIMTEFPDLKDKNSDLFKETAKLYQEAVRIDPNAKKSPAALYMAAKAAKLSLTGRGRNTRREEDDDRDYRREDEEDRRARVNSQDSRPRGRSVVEEDDDLIGDQARDVIRQMGISDDEFKAAQKVTGRSRGGRR